MDHNLIEHVATLRTVVGYLGEREQYAWWQSSFFGPGSKTFLAPVFGRTQVLAQCAGVTRAAALIHDERIGVGEAYHLFRLPEDMEQGIHRALQASELSARITALTASKGVSLAHLREVASTLNGHSSGPVLIGTAKDLRHVGALCDLAAQYLHGFEGQLPAYPYFSGERA
jgi:hypothetical protein